MSSAEALERAIAAGYDLVEIAPGATPPVVKILDWGKYKYELTKQVQKNRKQQKQSEIKQVRLGLKIGDHDMDFKIRHARNFLGEGNKVKVALRFKGREITHPDLGRAVLDRFAKALEDVGSVEQQPQITGREMNMVIGVNKNAKTENS
jgi:translation initiation factor IF-3